MLRSAKYKYHRTGILTLTHPDRITVAFPHCNANSQVHSDFGNLNIVADGATVPCMLWTPGA